MPAAFIQCNTQQKEPLMKTEKQHFLNLRRLPARLSAEQTDWELGFEYHEIPLLVKANLLKPLGKPAPNGPKYYPTCVILKLKEDEAWLNKVCRSITQTRRLKNQGAKSDPDKS